MRYRNSPFEDADDDEHEDGYDDDPSRSSPSRRTLPRSAFPAVVVVVAALVALVHAEIGR